VDEVIALALSRQPEAIIWEEKPDEIAAAPGDARTASLPH
jgi:hypothetical protein